MKILAYTNVKLDLEDCNITYLSKVEDKSKIIQRLQKDHYEVLVFGNDLKGAVSCINELVKVNDLFPILFLTDNLDVFPNINPFKCLSQKEMEKPFFLKQLNSLVVNYSKTIQENDVFLASIKNLDELDLATEDRYSSLIKYYEKISWGGIKLPKMESKTLNTLKDLLEKTTMVLDKMKEEPTGEKK